MDQRTVNYQRIEKAIRYLLENFRSHPGLDDIAAHVGISPFYFQKIFVDWVGISAKRFLQFLTVDYLRHTIHATSNTIEAAELAGLSSQSRVSDWFVHVDGVSPFQFRTSGVGLEIAYGYHPTPFGMCFIAVTGKGICNLKFVDETRTEIAFEHFARQWQNAILKHRPDYTRDFILRIFGPGKEHDDKLKLLVRRTDFPVKVWEALLEIPFGSTDTYGQIAGSAGPHRSAAGKHPVSYLIPCHRIVSEDRITGGKRAGSIREMAPDCMGDGKTEAGQTM